MVSPVGEQLDPQVGERLVAVTAWPPQRRLGDLEVENGGVADDVGGSGAAFTGGADRQPCSGVPRHVGVHLDPADTVDDRDQGSNRGQPGRTPPLDPRRPPEAGGHEVGSPVPAVVARHLADRVERMGVGVDPRRLVKAGLLGRGQLGSEVDDQLGLARAHQVGDVEPVGAVLVPWGPEDVVAEPELADRVQPVEDQLDVLTVLRQDFGERRRIPPARPSDPLQGGLVLVEVRVRDQSGREQIGVYRAGHRRGDGTPGHPPWRRSVQRQQGPLGKGLCGHFTAPAVIPATKWRCTSRNPMTTGMLTTRDAAMIWFQ